MKEVEGTLCDQRVCEEMESLWLNGDCRRHTGQTGRQRSSGRMNQELKCSKQHRNEYMQARPGRLALWVVARSNRDEKQEANWACGSKENFGKQVSACPGTGGLKAVAASSRSLLSFFSLTSAYIRVTQKIYTLEMVRCPKGLHMYSLRILKLSF